MHMIIKKIIIFQASLCIKLVHFIQTMVVVNFSKIFYRIYSLGKIQTNRFLEWKWFLNFSFILSKLLSISKYGHDIFRRTFYWYEANCEWQYFFVLRYSKESIEVSLKSRRSSSARYNYSETKRMQSSRQITRCT